MSTTMKPVTWQCVGYPYISLYTAGDKFIVRLTVKTHDYTLKEQQQSIKNEIETIVAKHRLNMPHLTLIRCNVEVKSSPYFGRIIVQNMGEFPSLANLRILLTIKKKINEILAKHSRRTSSIPISSVV